MEVREAGDGAACGEAFRPPQKKYSWAEVRQAVHDLRKELCSLSTMVPMAISFRKLSNGKMRIYFLRIPQHGWEVTLLYTDVTPSNQPSDARLDWKPLFESVALGVTSGKWSREEQLLWERQRVAAWGIASYELHAKTGRVLFPCASSLFVAEERPGQSPPLIPVSVWSGGGAPLTPAMCPSAPSLVAHAARGDIWLAGGALTRPTRLTYACKGHEPFRLADDPRQAGVPCYVTQEEFSRYTGFWWQPHCEDGVYRIVYEEVDESDVKIYSFPSSQTSSGEVEEFRFPRAGTPNAKSILKMVTFRLQKTSPATVLDYYQEGASDLHTSESSNDVEVTDIRWYEMRHPLKETFPWFEYLARVGWTPCGQYVWVQLLDRKQQRLSLALIPLSEFSTPSSYELAPKLDNTTPHAVYTQEFTDIQVLVTESAPDAWVNVHDILHFLPSSGSESGGDKVSFVWATEETGHLHLGLYTCQLMQATPKPKCISKCDAWVNVHDILHFLPSSGSESGGDKVSFVWATEETGHLHLGLYTCQLMQATPKPKSVVELMITDEDTNAVGPNILSKEPITAGEWEVMARKIWVDEAKSLVYFVGLRETPLERHLYVAPLNPPQPAAVQLLTTVGHSCTVDIDQDCTTAVITTSNISTPAKTRVHWLRPALQPAGVLADSPESPEIRSFNGIWPSRGDDDDCNETSLLIREHSLTPKIPPPQILSTRLSCGALAYCTLWRCGRAGRSPTVLHVYGGPEVQTVTNTYKGIRQLRMHMLAARGFNVVAIDSRGSKHRGRAWEAAIRGKMGQVELDDQVEVLQWLAKETGCIDMDRIAIHGWSYGGYLSLLGLATRPGVFKVCVAGAPVTCWRLYDSAYTERYMGLPANGSHHYERASVLAHAPFFPDQEGRLLIIHGLADENVHFCHTAALLSELVRLGKPHRVQVYPGERHSLRAMHAAKHYEATLLHFLHENL